MIGVASGASFGITSDYIESRQQFDPSLQILVYVEGFEDIPFWHSIFSENNITVVVEAYGQCNKANGKGTLISAVRNGDITLGKHLLVALDSDYDYLLDKNTDVLSEPAVFQTYAYSIENLEWSPCKIDVLCQKSSNNTKFLPNGRLQAGIMDWSQNVYPVFLQYLKDGAVNQVQFDSIISSLDVSENAMVYTCRHDNITFTDSDFIEAMRLKGLTPDSVPLFIRGHDYSGRMNEHCCSINEHVFHLIKSEILATNSTASGQIISELKNKQNEPAVIVKGMPITCSFCLPKIQADIALYNSTYH
ncbi:DUF4435 domain-containing protein [Photobacterium damselae]|uniref:DUF4435 domain-containing protein n=1 Tax=Photobacterium damselae TaxID=38293 RepID=UPI002340B219|nr:DUF4435 domain-containing protein [Photobacterium damselae]MDC4167947.1 DUF4435 domain-containing protein [Photobacterium damselae]